jgi:hypothetical protein
MHLEAGAKGLREALPRGFIPEVKEAEQELLKNLGCHESMLAYVVGIWGDDKRKDVLGRIGKPGSQVSFAGGQELPREGERNPGIGSHLEAFETNRDRLMDLIQSLNN